MNDKLDAMPDSALNELFVVEVAGWRRIPTELHARFGGWVDSHESFVCYRDETPRYCTDANAVLPWLENFGPDWSWGCYCATAMTHPYRVTMTAPLGKDYTGYAATFARAAVIAMLRAKRAQKGRG